MPTNVDRLIRYSFLDKDIADRLRSIWPTNATPADIVTEYEYRKMTIEKKIIQSGAAIIVKRHNDVDVRWGLSRTVDLGETDVVIQVFHREFGEFMDLYRELLIELDRGPFLERFPNTTMTRIGEVVYGGSTYMIDVSIRINMR